MIGANVTLHPGAVIGLNTRTLVRGADLAIPTVTLRRVVDVMSLGDDEAAALVPYEHHYLVTEAIPAIQAQTQESMTTVDLDGGIYVRDDVGGGGGGDHVAARPTRVMAPRRVR